VKFPEDRLYSKEHEWILVDGDEGTIGITDFAQDQLGDIVYVESPPPGTMLSQDAAFGVVESVKSVSDIYAPVSGEVIARNEKLDDAPELVNDDPYGRGWIVRIRLADPAELDRLLNSDAYRAEIGGEPGNG